MCSVRLLSENLSLSLCACSHSSSKINIFFYVRIQQFALQQQTNQLVYFKKINETEIRLQSVINYYKKIFFEKIMG